MKPYYEDELVTLWHGDCGMNETVCNCGKPTRDAAYTCDECLGGLTKALAEVPWLAGELEVTMTRQKGIDYTSSRASRGAEVWSKRDDEDNEVARKAADAATSLPYGYEASEARRDLRNAMRTAVRFCTEEHIRHQSSTNTLPVDSLESMSRWLMWRVDGLGLSDMGFEFVTDILAASQKCRRVIDRKPEQRYAGPCECGRDLYHKPGAVQVACKDCERTYDVGELYAWMKSQVMGRLVTVQEGATLLSRFALETPKRIIYGWEERKRLVAKGENAAGQKTYLFDDLLALAAQRSA